MQRTWTDLLRMEAMELGTISEILEIDRKLASEINQLHMMEMPAIEIAEALEFEYGEDELDLPHIPV
jgi:hypothetical protein